MEILPLESCPAHPSSPMTTALVIDHVPHVRQVAGKIARRCPPTVDRADLVADGYVGLVKAARDYDPARGVPFWGFACRRVQGAIVDGMRQGPRSRKYGRRGVARPLEVALGDATAAIMPDRSHGPWERALAGSRGKFLREALASKLTKREAMVIRKTLQGHALRHIGNALGVCESRVSQIRADAVRKLQQALSAS